MTSHDLIFQSFAAITAHFIKYSLSLCETVPMVALSQSPGTPVPTGDFFKGRKYNHFGNIIINLFMLCHKCIMFIAKANKCICVVMWEGVLMLEGDWHICGGI